MARGLKSIRHCPWSFWRFSICAPTDWYYSTFLMFIIIIPAPELVSIHWRRNKRPDLDGRWDPTLHSMSFSIHRVRARKKRKNYYYYHYYYSESSSRAPSFFLLFLMCVYIYTNQRVKNTSRRPLCACLIRLSSSSLFHTERTNLTLRTHTERMNRREKEKKGRSQEGGSEMQSFRIEHDVSVEEGILNPTLLLFDV